MTDTIRLFVAVPIPDQVIDEVSRAVEKSRPTEPPGLRWVSPDKYHLTIKFLGEVPSPKVKDLVEVLGRAGDRVPAFNIQLAGGGCFPSRRRPRVVWIGVEGEKDPFRRLAGRVDRLTGELGFPGENRSFSPHLTLARRRTPDPVSDIDRFLAPLEDFRSSPFRVEFFHLMKSQLLPGGPIYSMIESFPLKGEKS